MTGIACPICKQNVARADAFYPFCSERCRLIDLGNWLGGRYRVPGESGPGGGDEPDRGAGAHEPDQDS